MRILLVFGLLAFAALTVPAKVAAQATSAGPAVQAPATMPSAATQTSGTPARAARPDHVFEPQPDDLILGAYGPDRANNDLLYYHLSLRVDPEKKTIAGSNTIRFKMLADAKRIEIDLIQTLNVDRILLGTKALAYTRDRRAVLIDFPRMLRKGRTYSIDFYYSGTPVTAGRFGTFNFGTDTSGHPWITTSCEGTGASAWWPDKDQWRDEPQEGMLISVEVPNGLTDVSNGRFVGSTDLHDGYTRWEWLVHYPINNYDVALNIGNYVHFSDSLDDLTLDFYALPEDLDKAKIQFAQAKGMLQAYQHYLGEYPFKKDGYKLIEVPYAGMEHQSAVAYGNHFANGYLGKDWTGVGISPRFDFIIIHESGHEWFGNAISAADRSDMWIHEGWTTYLESLFVEYTYGQADALKYNNAYKLKVHNQQPIIPARLVNAEPPQDQYFKGTLFINTLRSIVNDDSKWWPLLHDLFQHFKYRNIMTEDIVAWFNQREGAALGLEFTPIFNQYLRHAAIPVLELRFGAGTVDYRWKVDEKGFAMPIKVGDPKSWQLIHPTAEWKTMPTSLDKDKFAVATDYYYVDVNKQ
jgi:aminopeptidase N